MAAGNVIFNLSRSPLPQSTASHSLNQPSLQTSRVCFASASKFSKGGSTAEMNRRWFDGKVWSTKAKPTTEEDMEDDKQLLEKIAGAATEYAEETMENVKGATGAISETAKVYGVDAKEKTTEAAETIAAKADVGTKKVEEPGTETTPEVEGEEEPKETAEKV